MAYWGIAVVTQSILFASHEPEPEDVGALFADVDATLRGYAVTEPFAPDYTGEIIAKDWGMLRYLGEQATSKVFADLFFTLQHVGHTALHFNSDTVHLN